MAKKLFFKIGEACKELDVQPYVLRYWETEFPFLKPDKSKSGQRVYTADELAVIRRIKELLYDEGYTIAGAKKKLEGELQGGVLHGIEAAAEEMDNEESEQASEDDVAEQEQLPEVESVLLDSVPDERIQQVARGLRGLRDEANDLLRLLRGET